MEKKIEEFNWEELDTEKLVEQSEIYEGIVDDILNSLSKEDKRMVFQYIEIERELNLRENA